MKQKPTSTIKKAIPLIKQRGLLTPATGEKDSEVIQLNPRELGLLQSVLRMPGHKNPSTGLLSFSGQGPHGGGTGGTAGGGDGGGGGVGGGGGRGSTGTTAGGQSSPEGGFGGGERGSPAGRGATGPAGGGMSSSALRDMSPQTSPNISIARAATGISPDQAARDERAQMNATNLGNPGYYSGAPPSPGQLATRRALGLLGIDYSPNVTGTNTVNPDGTTSVTGLTDHLGIDPVHAALAAAGMIPGPVGMAASLGSLAYSGAKATGMITGPNNVGFGFDHGPGGSSSSSPAGSNGGSGNNNGGPDAGTNINNQMAQNALNASTGQMGIPPNIPGLNLHNMQFGGQQVQTTPGYGFQVPNYNAWRWG